MIETTTDLFAQPKAVSGLDMVFGYGVSGLMPSWSEIPDEFKRDSEWTQIGRRWFFEGLKGATFHPKSGIDKQRALSHVKAILGSFEPKHEHKEAAVGYLLSKWFGRIELPGKKVTS